MIGKVPILPAAVGGGVPIYPLAVGAGIKIIHPTFVGKCPILPRICWTQACLLDTSLFVGHSAQVGAEWFECPLLENCLRRERLFEVLRVLDLKARWRFYECAFCYL